MRYAGPVPITRYAIAIGSNRRGRHGAPRAEVAAAIVALGGTCRASRIIDTAPIGPSIRRFANAAVLIDTSETPPELLGRLKRIEHAFGRRAGRRWGARVIDLDIILWSRGTWAARHLTIPHAAFRERGFVLDCLIDVAPDWRDPVTGWSVRQIARRRRAPRPTVDRAGARA